jgi:hypothetical protein
MTERGYCDIEDESAVGILTVSESLASDVFAVHGRLSVDS